MAIKRYRIKEVEGFEDVRCFDVEWNGKSNSPFPETTQVWLSRNTARCTRCQGDLVAMRSDCPHANAVKRSLKKVRV